MKIMYVLCDDIYRVFCLNTLFYYFPLTHVYRNVYYAAVFLFFCWKLNDVRLTPRFIGTHTTTLHVIDILFYFICYTFVHICEGVWFLIVHTTNLTQTMTDGDDEQTIKLLKHVKGAWVSHLLGGIFMSMRECVSPFFTPRLICRTVKINHLMHFMLNREYFICAQ